MAEPVIDNRVGILSVEEGGELTHQFAATNTPTSWSATGLPSGFSISNAGLLTGDAAAGSAGVYQVVIKATNVDGTGTLTILIPIFSKPVLFQDELTIGIDINVVTGKVTILGVSDSQEWGPPTASKRNDGYTRATLAVRSGDRFPVSIGFVRPDGTYQNYDVRSLRGVFREFATDPTYNFLDGDVIATGEGTLMPRYLTTMTINDDVWATIISNYEEELDAYADAQASIEVSLLDANSSYSSEKTETLTSMAEGQTYTKTLNFTGLTKTDTVTEMTIEADLTITGLSSNTRALTATFGLTWDGSTFVVSDFSGADSDGGTEALPLHWNATLNIVSVTGTATGVTVVYTVVTDEPDGYFFEFVRGVSFPSNLILQGGYVGHTDGGYATDKTVYLTAQVTTASQPPGISETYNVDVPPIETSTLTYAAFMSGLLGDAYYAGSMYGDVTFFPGESPQRILLEVTDPVPFGVEPDIGYEAVNALHFTIDSTDSTQVYPIDAGSQTKNGSLVALMEGEFENIFRKTSETFILRGEKESVPNE